MQFLSFFEYLESVSDKLNSKQYQAIIEKLTKEKEHLENRCANREEELINIQAMISCINEDNECLMKINESLNQENKRLRRENQCIKEESKISTLNIEDSKNDSTEIQRTISKLKKINSVSIFELKYLTQNLLSTVLNFSKRMNKERAKGRSI